MESARYWRNYALKENTIARKLALEFLNLRIGAVDVIDIVHRNSVIGESVAKENQPCRVRLAQVCAKA